MILRVVRLVVDERDEPTVMSRLRQVADRSVGEVDGLIEVRLARAHEGDSVVVLGLSLWRDYGAIRAFFGPDVEKPLLLDPEGELWESAEVTHYEEVLTARGDPGRRSVPDDVVPDDLVRGAR